MNFLFDMIIYLKSLKISFLILFLLATASDIALSQDVNKSNYRFVAWNIEHLAENNEEGCVARSDQDYEKLRNFAATMDADIVALQEVESVNAVARVFPENEWEIVLSDRPSSGSYECRGSGRPSTQQRVAFAVKKGIEFEKIDSFKELALNNPGLRYGLVIRLTGTPEPIEVMNVHMKSGCFVNDYSTSDRDACETFEQQVPVLDKWVESKVKEKKAFVILGDFNHRITTPENRFWKDLEDMDGNKISIKSSMEGIRGCHPRYPDPIDHILAGPNSLKYYSPASENVFYFGKTPETMTEDDMLSDHCPISVDLNFAPSFPVSSAVLWTQNSAEYGLITSFLYQEAQKNLKSLAENSDPWVVIMDVDETLLDNSEYNRRRDKLGLGYTSESWAEWVKEEAATEIPGSKQFVTEVLKSGGQIALITNRNRSLDDYTWNNLRSLGFPIERINTCILGRNEEDVNSVDGNEFLNDKDLRRNQISNGTATDCWENYSSAKTNWNRNLEIMMQVGDNIKDFTRTTQENVDMKLFLSRQAKDILILPNAMYGSWD
ncbi:MAG: HAD family acid phosphatase [Balneola sp.]